MTSRFALAIAIAAALALICLLGLVGGMTYPLDVAAIRYFVGWRAANPQSTGAIILFTHLGSGIALLSMTAAAGAWLLWRRKMARALALAGAVIGARFGTELIKLFVNRPRPSLDEHPVVTFSHSFPSGHAGNSMATFLALALFAAPERWRGAAVALAIALSMAMGATRPMLGVHWPSDVLAGWIFGALVVSLAWWWLGRRETAA
jgi:membrane-associated phospholipid phosphatase